MRVSQLLCHLAAAVSLVAAICLDPEPETRICYTADRGATPQCLSMRDVTDIARHLRRAHERALREPGRRSALFKMPEADADNCAEWLVHRQGSVWALAKLVGSRSAAVTLKDIADTIDPPGSAADAHALVGCGTDGGQMGVRVNTSDPIYRSKLYTIDGYTNRGILIKLVKVSSNTAA